MPAGLGTSATAVRATPPATVQGQAGGSAGGQAASSLSAVACDPHLPVCRASAYGCTSPGDVRTSAIRRSSQAAWTASRTSSVVAGLGRTWAVRNHVESHGVMASMITVAR
jgi:hypothetical protein